MLTELPLEAQTKEAKIVLIENFSMEREIYEEIKLLSKRGYSSVRE